MLVLFNTLELYRQLLREWMSCSPRPCQMPVTFWDASRSWAVEPEGAWRSEPALDQGGWVLALALPLPGYVTLSKAHIFLGFDFWFEAAWESNSSHERPLLLQGILFGLYIVLRKKKTVLYLDAFGDIHSGSLLTTPSYYFCAFLLHVWPL